MMDDKENGDPQPGLKKRHIHNIMKFLSPKRSVTSPKKGERSIHRSISPEAVNLTTQYFNNQLEEFVQACEMALLEENMNPNTCYKTFRYNETVIKRAIKLMKDRESERNV